MPKKKKKKDRRAEQRARNRQRADNSKRGSGSNHVRLPDGMDFMEIKGDNKYKLDVLPFSIVKDHELENPVVTKDEEIWWRRQYHMHRNIGVNNNRIVCPSTIGKKCPICEERQRLFDKDQGEDAKPLRPSLRSLMLVREKGDDSIKMLDISDFALCQQIAIELTDPDNEEHSLFYDYGADEGRTLILRFEEESMGGKSTFPKCSRVDFKPRKDLGEEILEETSDPLECLDILSYEELKKKFLEFDDNDKEEEPDDEEPDDDSDEEPDDDSDDEPEDDDTPDLDEMNKKELLKYAKENDISIPADKKKNEGRLRKFLKEEQERLAEEDDDEPDECPFEHDFGEDYEDFPEDCTECDEKVRVACKAKYDEDDDVDD